MTATGDRRLRVSMLVRNSFQHDSRVEKEARTLVDVGYQQILSWSGEYLVGRNGRRIGAWSFGLI